MAQLTLAQIRTHVQQFTPDKATAAIDNAVNRTVEDLALEFGNQDRGTFTTLPKVTTGTVTATQDSTAVVGSGTAFASTYLNGLIQIEGQDAWFMVPTVTDPTNIVLSSAWHGTTSAGLTYTLVQPQITFPTTVLRIIKMWQRGRLPLRYALDDKGEEMIEWDEGEPEVWFDAPFGSTGQVQVRLTPYPDTRYLYEYTYMKQPTLLSADGDLIPFPSHLNSVVLAGVLSLIWDQEDAQDRSMAWLQRYEMLKRKARGERVAERWMQSRLVRGGGRYMRSVGDIGG